MQPPAFITLSESQKTELKKLAINSLPSESCAFLLGKESAVREVLPMKNADNSRVSFSIPPYEILEAYRLAGSKGLDVIGIFHSHPSSPAPSATDKRFMEINPVVWLIFSTTEDRFAAWVFADSVKKVEVRA